MQEFKNLAGSKERKYSLLEINAIFQRCYDLDILKKGLDGVTVVYTLNSQWRDILRNI